ncbi:MAG: Veg family protein [Bacillota bacterium]|nr:MAG: Veg protein [Bacillota bacterium]
MASKSVLADIKRDLDSHIGARIRLRANKGRKKVLEREGILEQTYPNIFTVRIRDGSLGERRVSYSYTDLLTEDVELVIYDANGEVKFAYHGR